MKLRIGCSTYEFKKVKRTFDIEHYGVVNPDLKKIVIYNSNNQEMNDQSVWHEVVHAILYEIQREDLSNNEDFVEIFSKHIHAFLKDNNLEKIYKNEFK